MSKITCDGESDRVEKILLVDDEPSVNRLLEHWLTDEGFECVGRSDATSALACLDAHPCALAIVDVRLKEASGIELARTVHDRHPDVATVVATGFGERSIAIESAEAGVYGYLSKPYDRNVVIATVLGALHRRSRVLADRRRRVNLEINLQRQQLLVHDREVEIAHRLVAAAETRDNETGAHIRRIGAYSAAIARALGWRADRVDEIAAAAMMHDIGKIGIPDNVLRKPGKLTRDEFECMKMHTVIGARILGRSKVPLLVRAREIALHHHERWDGCGYPLGLTRRFIPESARLVAIADTYDALVNARVYKPAYPEDVALDILRKERGVQLDPKIVDAFLSIHDEIQDIRAAIKESEMFPFGSAAKLERPSPPAFLDARSTATGVAFVK